MDVLSKGKFSDGILWVGGAYEEIFCNLERSCAIPFKTGRHCYVHEAIWRGCCLKIPEFPNWAIPGETRIFLVHKGNYKNTSRGRIFGYFVLERIEIIQPENRAIIKKYKSGASSVPISNHDTLFEHRFAYGHRLKPGSIYIVDALSAQVTDTFKKELDKVTPPIWPAYIATVGAGAQLLIRKNGENLFRNVVCKIHAPGGIGPISVITGISSSRISKGKIPSGLSSLAKLRGELVVFNNPPLFVNCPDAAFRGLRRMDGDSLIDQIIKGNHNPIIHYYLDEEKLSDREIAIARIAEEAKVNRSLSQRIISIVPEIIADELKSKGIFMLRGFGTFKVVDRKARAGINPKTRAKITIPAQKAVRFKTAKKLKNKVKT